MYLVKCIWIFSKPLTNKLNRLFIYYIHLITRLCSLGLCNLETLLKKIRLLTVLSSAHEFVVHMFKWSLTQTLAVGFHVLITVHSFTESSFKTHCIRNFSDKILNAISPYVYTARVSWTYEFFSAAVWYVTLFCFVLIVFHNLCLSVLNS